ncbi:HAMP domain-containing sensor histidine kinase [Caloranaerobacter azorensis]|uniref:HAMP domain-containing sensor histidine kinase n=1 Tax=Caloranaerobacter azorensis TaxID=116090 RepID=UPI0018CF81FE|nr:ATP-binding protein [Caloranaerobacter azorensis]
MSVLKGIKRRWVVNYILIILLVMVVLEGLFMFFVRKYYYDSIKQSLTNRSIVVAGFYNKYLNVSMFNFKRDIEKIIEEYTFNDYAEIQAVDLDGNIIQNSSGFERKEKVVTSDFHRALRGFTGCWIGRDVNTDEKIMAVSTPLLDSEGKIVGVLRYVTSIEKADSIIKKWFLMSLAVMMVVLILMLILSIIFTRTIINPIKEITKASKDIAKGNLSIKIDKLYNDEIGELADTINFMASELSKVQRMKNEFISSISHELRTPLTSIKGWSETILTGDLDNKEETKLGLEIIIKETERLTKMVEELLDFSRFESGRIYLNYDVIDIKKELDEIILIFEGKAKKKEIELNYSYSSESILINGDKNRLRQVFINILDNAIKFTDRGKKIFVNIYEDENNVYIDFRDEGIGISEKDINKVKEKFYKGSSKKSGSGLGLAISNEIIKLHGGALNIESQEGEGTLVKLILPKDICLDDSMKKSNKI